MVQILRIYVHYFMMETRRYPVVPTIAKEPFHIAGVVFFPG